jgi:bifunctional NMN adenylyltransferase/nudix hydrolase
MNATGVIIARFQTPYLHEGHQYLLNAIRAKHNKVVIVLGIAPVKGSVRNPFDYYTREKLLKAFCPDLIVLPLTDHPSDSIWSKNLDQLLHTTFVDESFVLYGSRDSFISYYHGELPVQALEEKGTHSATTIRVTASDKVLDSEDFRMGINYAYHNTYAKVYPTVDIALLKDNSTAILLGKKHNQQGWRLPGGFVDPNDNSYESAAKRELLEECGAIECSDMQYVGTAKVDDWRYRNENDKIITTLYTTKLIYGDPKANDDLEALKWFKLNDLDKSIDKGEIIKEHLVLIDLLMKSLEKVNNQPIDLANSSTN